MDRTVTEVDVDVLLAALTLEEKVALLAGKSVWVTTPVPRLGIPAIKVTDGPNGARGNGASGASAASFPVGSALASTWNTALLREVGAALGQEARSKNAQVLLGPTVNLHRTPLGGRNFECYSEDPWLSGLLAAAFIHGVQSQRVGACIKHFVCNDSEYQRHSISSEVDERTLREVYLAPFEIAIREARPWTLMSAYNRINGTFASSHEALLRGVLKDEWDFDGVVISDWGAALETEENLNGGLDLEMPGPTRTRGAALVAAVRDGRVPPDRIDDAARRMLRLIERSGRFAEPDPQPERSEDRPEHRALARRAAAEGMVLIRNDGLLPLDPQRIRRLAVIGPNARVGQIQGGGSSAVFPHYQVMPLEGLTAAADWTVSHADGCRNDKYLPLPEPGTLTVDGTPGLWLRLFNRDAAAPATAVDAAASGNDAVSGNAAVSGNGMPVLERRVEFGANPMGGLPLNQIGGRRLGPNFTATLEATLRVDTTGDHQFGLVSAGLSRLSIDGAELIDNWSAQSPGDAFFGQGSSERRATRHLEAGIDYALRIDYRSDARATLISGVRFGLLPPQPADLLDAARATAAAADAVVLVVGSNSDWETEGNDRSQLELPGAQDALIDAVLQANPDTLVVVNTGAAITMPWLPRARAVLQAWLPGQEFGNALADLVTGRVNPSGRMPTTFPQRLEDTPAFTSYPGENGRVFYGERGFIGYRWYDARGIEPLVAFGHGLSYTSFDYRDLQVERTDGGRVRVALTVVNTGDLAGQEVVQLYLAPPGAPEESGPADSAPVQRASQELRAFAKVSLAAGASEPVQFELGPREFAHWDVTGQCWTVAPGRYRIHVGASSRDIRLHGECVMGAC